jgi:hypothetical protein
MTLMLIHLPAEMSPYEHDLSYFFETMVRKLHVNRHKGTSKDLDVPGMVRSIRRELREFEEALKRGDQFAAPVEAADIANFAFLLSAAIWQMTRVEFDALRAGMDRAENTVRPGSVAAQVGE